MAHYLEKHGADRRKLVIGMAFFGRGFTLRDADENDIGVKATGPSRAFPSTQIPGFFAYYEVLHCNDCQLINDQRSITE